MQSSDAATRNSKRGTRNFDFSPAKHTKNTKAEEGNVSGENAGGETPLPWRR
jgi:hypothetical protein